MKVIRSAVCGFCMGVRRAVELAAAEADQVKNEGGRVFTLGPLIHNPVVLSDLQSRGVETWEFSEKNINREPAQTSIVIRAHGIDPQTEKKFRDAGCRVIDATCPKVKASQQKAEELARNGYFIFLAGEAEHAEIESIRGYAENGSRGQAAAEFCVVNNAVEAEKAAAELYETNKDAKTALLGQTTISPEEYSSIGISVKKYFPNLEIFQTICTATKDRQQALRELLDKVDAVIVAGGKESANTRRLLAIAQESGKPCALAENAAEIPPAFRSYKTIGLCAGASTPDSVIDEIELELEKKI